MLECRRRGDANMCEAFQRIFETRALLSALQLVAIAALALLRYKNSIIYWSETTWHLTCCRKMNHKCLRRLRINALLLFLRRWQAATEKHSTKHDPLILHACRVFPVKISRRYCFCHLSPFDLIIMARVGWSLRSGMRKMSRKRVWWGKTWKLCWNHRKCCCSRRATLSWGRLD